MDNEFLVPHGYLSDEEGDTFEVPLSPTEAKERLKLKGEQFEKELKEKTCHIKPNVIGCCWQTDIDQESQKMKVLQKYAAVILFSTPVCVNNELLCDAIDSPSAVEDSIRSGKIVKRMVNESDLPSLIRLLHGNADSRSTIVKEFQSYLERNRSEDKSGRLTRKFH